MSTKKNLIESLIHKKNLLEHLIYAAQQIEISAKFNVKDINELLSTYQQGSEIKPELLKSSLLNLRGTISNIKENQISEIQDIFKKLSSQLKNL